MGRLLRISGVVAGVGAVLYQLVFKELLFTTIGVGRVIEPIENFSYTCKRVVHDRLEACEDLWLDEDARVLYAACTGSKSRLAWNPAMGSLDYSGRRPEGAELIALDIDSTAPDFNLRVISPTGSYKSATGDNTLDYVGFDVEVVDSSTLRFYLTNQRPPVDADLKVLDATKTGSNATIEIFELKRGASKMTHVRTVYSSAVYSPNRVAALGNGAFVVTNDHSVKVGMRKEFDTLIGGGNVAFCDASGSCHTATGSTKFAFPNGLTRGKDGLIYVPSAVDGSIKVFEVTSDNKLKQVNVNIKVGMPLDNLAADANGDIYAAGFPSFGQVMAHMANPDKEESAATVFKISKEGDGYKVEKVLEDGEKKVLSLVTTAVHDVKTDRLFIGSATVPRIVVCNPK